ncbi:MAG: molybdopterin molybdenumtransferase MoeA, partial [Eggerthellaceae bacterium]|nr:molybdopterin molybdenumtransferase MoeA [Eggerthellaceae bacterium]
DEIIPADAAPRGSQMRDVNTPVLAAAAEACGGEAVTFGIVPDDLAALSARVREALGTCDMVLVSGGSSAGQRDNTSRVLEELGELLFHGIAVKPGKPTMVADVAGKPVFGLPGHPVAAYFMFIELVRPLLLGVAEAKESQVSAVLAAGVPSNHGRAEFVAVRLEDRDGVAFAVPVRGKSGLISQLAGADGYFIIDRNREGVAAGDPVDVRLFAR